MLNEVTNIKAPVVFDWPSVRLSAFKAFYARLSYRNSVRPCVCRSRVDQSKTVQARITKSSPSTAWKTLVSRSLKLFRKFEGVNSNKGAK